MKPPGRPPESGFLKALYGPLRDDALEEVDLALKVALLLEYDIPQAVVAERLNVSLSEVKGAVKRLRRIRERIDRESMEE